MSELYELQEVISMDKIYTYVLSPMDFGFEALVPLRRYLRQATRRKKEYADVRWIVDAIYALAKNTSWQGDGEVFVSAIPDGTYPAFLLVVKQEHAGTTYVASQVEIPSLEDN